MAKTMRPLGAVPYDFDINRPRQFQQMEFVRHYVAQEKKDHKEAAKLAGYKSPSDGNKLMKIPWIVQEIAKRMEESNFRANVTADMIKVKLLELIEGCMQKVPVLNEEGEETGLFKFMDAGTARGAIKDLGEHVDVQAFVRNNNLNVNHSHTIGPPDIDVSKLSMEDQKALISIIVKASGQTQEDAPPRRIENTVVDRINSDAQPDRLDEK